MSSSTRSSSPPSATHAFLTQNFTNPFPCSHFFCAYEVAQSPHKNSMSGANTRSVLARFGDNNWEKGEDFVKTFYVKKLVWEMEGSLSACWMTCSGFRLRYDHIAKVVQSRMANYFQISPPLVFSYRLSFSPTTESYRLEFEFEESLPRKTASIFKEGIGHESNEAANQEKQIFLLCQISPSALSTRDLGTRLDKNKTVMASKN